MQTSMSSKRMVEPLTFRYFRTAAPSSVAVVDVVARAWLTFDVTFFFFKGDNITAEVGTFACFFFKLTIASFFRL